MVIRCGLLLSPLGYITITKLHTYLIQMGVGPGPSAFPDVKHSVKENSPGGRDRLLQGIELDVDNTSGVQ